MLESSISRLLSLPRPPRARPPHARPRLARPTLFLLLLALLPLGACAPGDGAPALSEEEAAAHRREIEAWQAERQASLSDPEGWRALVGLDWLELGETTVGRSDASDVVLETDAAPPHLGTFVVIDTDESEGMEFTEGPESVEGFSLRVRFRPSEELLRRAEATTSGEAAEGSDPVLTADGEPVTAEIPVTTDLSGDPTILELGSLELRVIARRDDYETRIALRSRDRDHPRLDDPPQLAFFPIDPAWRLTARFEPFEPPRELPVVNVLGMRALEPFPGALVFEHGGRTHRLNVMESGGEYFVIFSDPTNDEGATYPAGRYLYAYRTEQDGTEEGDTEEGDTEEGGTAGDAAGSSTVILDFNRAYNPPCAFTDHATCPLPPPGNQLPMPVTAGAEYRKSYNPHGEAPGDAGTARDPGAAGGQEGEDLTEDVADDPA